MCYTCGVFAYLFLELIYLMVKRNRKSKPFKENLNEQRVFLDGVEKHNEQVHRDPFYKVQPWMLVDSYMLVLVKQNDPRALFFSDIGMKERYSGPLILSSGKGLVLSSLPDYEHEGKPVKRITVGSTKRAMDIQFSDNYIKVIFIFYKGLLNKMRKIYHK